MDTRENLLNSMADNLANSNGGSAEDARKVIVKKLEDVRTIMEVLKLREATAPRSVLISDDYISWAGVSTDGLKIARDTINAFFWDLI